MDGDERPLFEPRAVGMAAGLIPNLLISDWFSMRAIPVSKLRNAGLDIVKSLRAGERIVITHRGKPFACLTPTEDVSPTHVDWSQSPAVQRDRSRTPFLSEKQSVELRHAASGRW